MTTADYLRFISKAQSFWFTLNTSYDHGCHLANRFRLDPEEYEALLIVAGLASYTRFGWLPNQDHGQLVVTLPLLVLSLCRPLVLSSRRLVVACVASRHAALSSSRCLVVPPLVLSHRASWLSHHHLSSSPCCTALSSSHPAGWLLHCLSLRRPLVLSS